MIVINDFKQLWLLLARTQEEMRNDYRHFCVRNIMRQWYYTGIIKPPPLWEGLDDAIWKVCHWTEVGGYDELPDVLLYPRVHRKMLCAIISVANGIGIRHVDTNALDGAFSQAFPSATPINVGKKIKRQSALG